MNIEDFQADIFDLYEKVKYFLKDDEIRKVEMLLFQFESEYENASNEQLLDILDNILNVLEKYKK